MKKDLLQTIKIITLSLLLSGSFAFAWTAPVGVPVASDTIAPINKSSDSQLKMGGLGTGAFVADGVSNFHGNVSIVGNVSGTTDYIFSFLEKNEVTKSFGNIIASLFKVNVVYADLVPICTDPSAINYNGPLPCDYGYPAPVIPYIFMVTPINYINSNMEVLNPISFTFKSDTAGTFSFVDNIDGCSSSTNTSVSANTNKTVTLNNLNNGEYSCSVILTTTDNKISNRLDLYFVVVPPPPVPPAPPIFNPSSSLYISGKVSVGSPTIQTEQFFVQGNVKVGSLKNTEPKLVHLCADELGKIDLCPSGGVTMSLNQTSWTVPDGVFRIHVNVSGGGGGGGSVFNYFNGGTYGGGGGGGGGFSSGDLNVVPGQVFSVGVGKGGASGGFWGVPYGTGGNGGNSYFGPYFSASGGKGGFASYKTGSTYYGGNGGVGGTGTTANGGNGGTGTSSCTGGASGALGGGTGNGVGGKGSKGVYPLSCGGVSDDIGEHGNVYITWTNLIN